MRTAPYAAVLNDACDRCGLDPTTLLTTDSALLNRSINLAARRAWEKYFWPELMLLEERSYRPAWSAQAYASAAEVYYPATLKYYRANATTAGGDVPGVSAKWDVIVDLDAYIDYAQAGQTLLGTVQRVYSASPRGSTARSAFPLPFETDERGLTLVGTDVPPTAWVRFRQRCPEWSGATYDATLTYAAGLTRYYSSATAGFEGDFWTVVSTTTAGQSPETTAAKWSKVSFPYIFKPYAAHTAYMDWLRAEGQTDKATVEADFAQTLLSAEYDQEGLARQTRRYGIRNAANR